MMSNPFHKRYLPSQKLQCIVRDIQVLHVEWTEGTELPPPFITCLANTEQNLYFYPYDPVRTVTKDNVSTIAPHSVLTGPKTRPVGIAYDKNYLMIRAAFHPTGLFRLLGTPMHSMVNVGLDARQFWGDEVASVLNSLRVAGNYDEMAAIVAGFLENKIEEYLRPEEPIDKTAVAMLDPSFDFSAKYWSDDACLSLRQFERNFVTRTGISPKLFARIVRFEYAMSVKKAMECGYTDSAHLLKEFRSFAEFPPSHFFLQPTSGHSELPTG